MRLTGSDAIEYAEAHDLSLGKYTDPVEDWRDDLTPDEAREVAREDPGLIYLDVTRPEEARQMERRAYQLTQSDLERAERKRVQRERDLARADELLATTTGKPHRRAALRKRDAAGLALQGDPEWQRGRGQGILDKLTGLPYHEERLSPAYNAGYYAGYNHSAGELCDLIAANPQFAEVS